MARDDRFAVIEAELWAGFEQREQRHREQLEALEQRLAGLQDVTGAREQELRRLRVRLDRIVGSAPYRIYQRLQAMPGLRIVRSRRTRAYEAEAAAERD